MSDDKVWYKCWPEGVQKTIEYPSITLHDHFEVIARKNADMTYLSLLAIEYSYTEVSDFSSRLASALIQMGIEKGDRIGLFMPNVPQFVIGFFGILKAGAIVVPISPVYGSEDLRFVLKDSGIKAIIALDILYETVEEVCPDCSDLKIVILASIGELLSPVKRILARLLRKIPASPQVPGAMQFFELVREQEPLAAPVKCEPDDVALLGYTGGTTGRPKGAMLTHRNLVSNMLQAREWAIQYHPKGQNKNFLGAVPFFHIIGLTTVMLATAEFDSTVYLVPNPRDFDFLLKTIHKNRVNYFHGVPTLFRALLKHPKFSKYDLSSLMVVFSGGAPLPAELAEEFEDAVGGKAIMVEAYGMTELSPMASANPLQREGRKFGSIGIPIVDTDLKIVDLETGEDLPQGEVGQILVRGPQVMKGYFNQPEETAATINEAGYLSTGDVGRMDEDGYFFIVNRVKDMINVSGYKVFPSEVEEYILNNLPQIQEAVVIPTPDEYQGESVKLFAVLKEGEIFTEDEVINFLKGKIASYKIPRKVEFRNELPKTGIGKIDRKLLRRQEFGEGSG
ncbi:MAG: long-chain fatty acid--CoA ligase [Candidatus Hodarchaeota archaeon]